MTAQSAAAAPQATVYGFPRGGPQTAGASGAPAQHPSAAGGSGPSAPAPGGAVAHRLADAGLHEIPTGDLPCEVRVPGTSAMLGTRSAAPGNAAGGVRRCPGPELGPDTVFAADSSRQTAELREAVTAGLRARPVLLGPVTYLRLAASASGGFSPLTLLERLLPVYAEILADLRATGAAWVQLDEPALTHTATAAQLAAAERAYAELGGRADRPRLLVASWSGRLGDALPVLAGSPVEGLAVDFTRGAADNLLALASAGGLPGRRLVAGVVDGRDEGPAVLEKALATLGTLLGLAGRVDVAPSCPLSDLSPNAADRKVHEVVTLARGLAGGPEAVAGELAANRAAVAARPDAPRIRGGRLPGTA